MSRIRVRKDLSGYFVDLSRPLDSRGKILYLIYSICFLIPTLMFSALFLFVPADLVAMLIALFAIGVCAVVSYKFCKSATGYEQLFLSTSFLTVIGGSVFGSVKKQIELNKIINIRHLEKPTLSDHPLKGGSFDYLGFQTEQKVISEMYGDKRVVVEHTEGQVFFGLDIYSWEFEEIIAIINNARQEVKEMSSVTSQ